MKCAHDHGHKRIKYEVIKFRFYIYKSF